MADPQVDDDSRRSSLQGRGDYNVGKEIWLLDEVHAPGLSQAVPVVVARSIPYFEGANRLQSLRIYLPCNDKTRQLVGTPVTWLPPCGPDQYYHAHVHGGAWRDPMTDAGSAEAAVALIFADPANPIAAVASLDYTLSEFPTHPTAPYDAAVDSPTDPAREAVHPRHVGDVYAGLARLASMGLTHGSLVLSGHSCGACMVFQAAFAEPQDYGFAEFSEIPVPAAVVGINGLYDLPGLVLGLGPRHEANAHDYRVMLTHAFGPDDRVWVAASPSRIEPAVIAGPVRRGLAPSVALVAQSPDDQLVPMSQLQRLTSNLAKVEGLTTATRHCAGKHADAWQNGKGLKDCVLDALKLLGDWTEAPRSPP